MGSAVAVASQDCDPARKSPYRRFRFTFGSELACFDGAPTNGARLRDQAAMTIGPDLADAVTAFDRFGFGARRGDLAAAAGDLGDAWKDTVVVAITEFGRTVRVNGAHGADHGTATAALLAGGALAGGRVIADWRSLKAERLYEGRDLYPTADLRGVLKGILADQFGITPKTLAEVISPTARA